MKAKVNLQLLNTTRFDSGSLGLMAMVIHQFKSPGRHNVIVLKEDQTLGEFSFIVDKKCEEMQLSIDLAETIKHKTDQLKCSAPRFAEEVNRVIAPDGYVMFFTSKGDGYSVRVASEKDDDFNSTNLKDGDLFATSLLEPGKYSVKNSQGEGIINVNSALNIKKKLSQLETVYVDVERKGFNPIDIELTSTQGLVFRIKDSARILIQKEEQVPKKIKKPLQRWQRSPRP